MNIVITMAGLGSRFRKKGYNIPKFMIEAKGKTSFYWALASLKNLQSLNSKFFFIVRKEDKATEFIISECDKLRIEKPIIIEIDSLTDGQATTALYAKDFWDASAPILIYNIDTHVEPDALFIPDLKGIDGWVPCFDAPGDSWSFVKLNREGFAEELREKTKISDHATIGLYYFSSAELYSVSYDRYYSSQGREEHGEKYIAPLYNQLIAEGKKIMITDIPFSRVHMMGTPDELEDFMSSNYFLS